MEISPNLGPEAVCHLLISHCIGMGEVFCFQLLMTTSLIIRSKTPTLTGAQGVSFVVGINITMCKPYWEHSDIYSIHNIQLTSASNDIFTETIIHKPSIK